VINSRRKEIMKLKKVIPVMMSIVMACSLAACSPKAGQDSKDNSEANSSGQGEVQQDDSKKDFDVLNVGILVSTVGIPALYAQEQGWFEEAGLDVNLQIFATGAPVNEAIAAGELDIACSGFASIYSLANADCTYLADINTTGGMGLYVNPDSAVAKAGNTLADNADIIGDAATVKGLKILEPLGTAVQYMTECYAAKFGLSPDDIEQTNMEYAAAFQAFTTGEGDAMAANPPYSYQLEDLGYTKVCSFDAATGVNMYDGAFARNEVVEKRSEEVQLFVNCIVKAMDALQDSDVRYEFTSQKYKDNAQDFSEENLKKELVDRTYCGTASLTSADYKFGEAWPAIAEFLVTAEKITADNLPNVESSLNPAFVSTAAGSEVSK
jgi:ABC-type nitrate/sulfonate/bicarbonate transport system substrate-binding protein